MANSLTTQLLQDGPRNTVVKVTGILDSGDVSGVVVVNPAALSSMQPGFSSYPPPDTLAIKAMDFSISDGTDVQIYYDATVPVLFEVLTGRGKSDFREIGFQQNNAGAGVNGKITLTTRSNSTPSSSNVITFTMTFWLIKQLQRNQDNPSGGGVLGSQANFSQQSNSQLIPVIPL